MKIGFSLSRPFHPQILRLAAVMLFALAWSNLSCNHRNQSIANSGEIHSAAAKGDLQKVKALLKDNPELIVSADRGGQTPLHSAAFRGQKNVVKLLLAYKANVNAKNNDGKTPLYYAVKEGNQHVAELLRQHGGHE